MNPDDLEDTIEERMDEMKSLVKKIAHLFVDEEVDQEIGTMACSYIICSSGADDIANLKLKKMCLKVILKSIEYRWPGEKLDLPENFQEWINADLQQ